MCNASTNAWNYTWALALTQENRLNKFDMKCLRTILGVNLGDRVSNENILQLSGQPAMKNSMRRNRLGWFGHANRMEKNNEESLVKKVMFCYFADIKRTRRIGIRKRWKSKRLEDIEKFKINNWRQMAHVN
ncbi:unnamed protein product [Rotaria sp. Silwood2]|nr:unnamed protein product [Rotaria sp. Silwood2]